MNQVIETVKKPKKAATAQRSFGLLKIALIVIPTKQPERKYLIQAIKEFIYTGSTHLALILLEMQKTKKTWQSLIQRYSHVGEVLWT